MIHVHDMARQKLDPKSRRGMFVGYALNRAGYRVWDSTRCAIVESRDVKFLDEKSLGNHDSQSSRETHDLDLRTEEGVANPPPHEGTTVRLTLGPEPVRTHRRDVPHISPAPSNRQSPDDLVGGDQEEPEQLSDSDKDSLPEKDPSATESPSKPQSEAGNSDDSESSDTEKEKRVEVITLTDTTEDAEDETEESEATGPPVRRSRRERTAPVKLMYDRLGVQAKTAAALAAREDAWTVATAFLAIQAEAYNAEPVTYQEAMKAPDSAKWREAMDEEISSLTENCAFTPIELPRGAKPVKSKWVYKIKKNSDGTTRYKARLVAKGFTQRYGVDYLETFAPVVKYKSLRILLALANEKRWIVHQMDVTTAFLYGEIDREIYMIPPDGVDTSKDGRKVWRLDRSLYGLKQSPRCWNQRIHNFLVTRGFVQIKSDTTTYTKGKGTKQVVLALYVDDMLIMSASEEEVGAVKKELSTEYKMKDLGEVDVVLGMRVRRSIKDGWLTIDQEDYATEVLKKFGMWYSKPQQTPVSTDIKLSARDCPEEQDKYKMASVPYRSVIGSLMYLMVSTRPDLDPSLSILSRFLANPGEVH